MDLRVWLWCRRGQREAEAPAVQRGDGADGQDGQSSDGGRQPRPGSLHQRHASGTRQAHVQGNASSAHPAGCTHRHEGCGVIVVVSSAGMDAVPGCFQCGPAGLRRHRGGLAVSGRNPLCHQDSMHLLHTGAAATTPGSYRIFLFIQLPSDTDCLRVRTVGEGCVRAGSGEVHPADGELRHRRNEAEEHRHHQDPHHCGSHRRQLPGQLLARGVLLLLLFKLSFTLPVFLSSFFSFFI